MFKVLKDRRLGFGFENWGQFDNEKEAIIFGRDEYRSYSRTLIEYPDGTRRDPYSVGGAVV